MGAKRERSAFTPLQPLRIKGDSMAPALLDHQLVIAIRPREMNRNLPAMRGKIIAFHHPKEWQRIYVKRIVGLPNEYVSIENNSVAIDGEQIPEPYLAEPMLSNPRVASKWITGWDEIFLLGDNRNDSEDSRNFGPVGLSHVVGEIKFRFWPPGLL